MVWAPRNDERSLRKLDNDLRLKISGRGSIPTRRLLLEKLHPTELLHEMSPPVYYGTKEKIIQKETHYGRRNAVGLFLDEVTAYNGWALALLDALNNTGFDDIAQRLCDEYSPPPDEGPSGGGPGSGPGGGPSNSDDLRNSDNGNYRNHDTDMDDPPPPYDEAVGQDNDVTGPKTVDNPLKIAFNRNRSERRNTDDNRNILVANDKNPQEDGHSSRSRDDRYVENERAVVVDCAHIQPTPQNNNQNRFTTLTEQIASNSSTQQNSTSTPTLTSSQAPTNDSAKSTMTNLQSKLSSDSSSSNSEPDSFDLARKGPANDFSPVTILNIGQSDCYNSSDTTSDNNFTQQFPQEIRSSEESDIPKKAPFDDETKSNSNYLHSVDPLRLGYDPSSECKVDEKPYESLVTDDMKFSHDATNVTDKLEKPIEIKDEGEELTSDVHDMSTMKQEGNSTDFINFNSREVVQPPTPGSQAPIASAREMSVLSVGSTIETSQSDMTIATASLENLSINEDNQLASQTEESLNHQASSMADGDHSDTQTSRTNIQGEFDQIDGNTAQQSETTTSEEAYANPDDDAEKAEN